MNEVAVRQTRAIDRAGRQGPRGEASVVSEGMQYA